MGVFLAPKEGCPPPRPPRPPWGQLVPCSRPSPAGAPLYMTLGPQRARAHRLVRAAVFPLQCPARCLGRTARMRQNRAACRGHNSSESGCDGRSRYWPCPRATRTLSRLSQWLRLPGRGTMSPVSSLVIADNSCNAILDGRHYTEIPVITYCCSYKSFECQTCREIPQRGKKKRLAVRIGICPSLHEVGQA